MTGFELYRFVKERYPELDENPLGSDELAEIVANSKETLRANCGELRRFSDPAVTSAIMDFIKRGGLFETSCGKYICAGEDRKNPLIKALHENGYLGSDEYLAYVNYSSASPLENVMIGSTHAIISDDGEVIFVEEPHGCTGGGNSGERKGLLIRKDYELAEILEGFIWSDVDYQRVLSLDDDFIAENTLMSESPRWEEEDYCAFETKEQFESCVASYMIHAVSGAE